MDGRKLFRELENFRDLRGIQDYTDQCLKSENAYEDYRTGKYAEEIGFEVILSMHFTHQEMTGPAWAAVAETRTSGPGKYSKCLYEEHPSLMGASGGDLHGKACTPQFLMEDAMQIDLEHDEIVTLITLLTEHMVKTFPEGIEDFTHPDSPLCLKLHDAREQYTRQVKSNRK